MPVIMNADSGQRPSQNHARISSETGRRNQHIALGGTQRIERAEEAGIQTRTIRGEFEIAE
jgi:hypothetical protein